MLEKNEIENIVMDFFDKMGFDTEILALKIGDNLISIKIKTEDPKFLIGKNGQILSDIQHILGRLLKRKFQELFYLDIDINDYKERKIDYLKGLARDLADEVSLTKKEKQLWPMQAQERRVIHLELSERRDIITESLGEGTERRITIKPR